MIKPKINAKLIHVDKFGNESVMRFITLAEIKELPMLAYGESYMLRTSGAFSVIAYGDYHLFGTPSQLAEEYHQALMEKSPSNHKPA